MTQNRNDSSELVDVLKRLARESDKDYDLSLVKKIVECESDFADNPDESQRAKAKQKIRAIVQKHID
jgi:hypothetical protein